MDAVKLIINQLEQDNKYLKETLQNEQKRLREAAGAWRKKANRLQQMIDGGGTATGVKRECLREGYNHPLRKHYKLYVVTDIPEDLDIQSVCEWIREYFMPMVSPYFFTQCSYSTKYRGWMVEVEKTVHFDMNIVKQDEKDREM